MIAKPNLKQLQQKLGYVFKNESLLTHALTHRSYSADNNERLEFLGDALLGVTIAERLYHQFPTLPEGVLSRQRSRLVKGETLADIAREFSLSDYLILGAGELKSGGFRRDSILADAVEAIIGAIFLDSDMQQCQQTLIVWFESRLTSLSPEDSLKDPKTQLQELLQSQKFDLPVYSVLQVEGASHQQTFTVSCQVKGLDNAVTATASNRRQAEKQAAAEALMLLQAKSR